MAAAERAPAGRVLAREQIYQTLRERIIVGAMAPGERVRDAALAEQLGVSRTPVREALQRLADEGLIETVSNRSTRVAALDPGQAEQIYPIIWRLEMLAVKDLPKRLDQADLNQLAAANVALQEALAANDAVAATAADHSFHQIIVAGAGNPELIRVLDDLKTKARRLEIAAFPGYAQAAGTVLEHGRILDALDAGDRGRAARVIRRDWRQTRKRLRQSPSA